MKVNKKVFLLVLDGFGLRRNKASNGPKLAGMKHLEHFFSTYPFSKLDASGQSVGLPKDFLGGSEVGHMNIGAGRIVLQGMSLINKAIANGEFFENKVFLDCMTRAKEKKKSLHLMGLLSDAGIHSHIDHLFALLKMSKDLGLKDVYIHFFLDGRDVPPTSSKKYVKIVEKYCAKLGVGKIASVEGRFYGMDRDKREERIALSYHNLTKGKGKKANTALEAIDMAYKRGETDEFVLPTTIKVEKKQFIQNGDSVIHYNFRADRARELTEQLNNKLKLNYACMQEYNKKFRLPVAFPFTRPTMTLGEYISALGGTQLRVAETEKYAHVTFFFSGGRERKFPGEERILIPSDRTVATYDEHPAMRTREIADKACAYVKKKKPDLVVCNIAAPDMVGHTGSLPAVIKALGVVDESINNIYETCKKDYALIIIADHGNCDEMTGEHQTSHTLNKVPFCLIDHDKKGRKKKYSLKSQGVLGDVAPSILKIMGLKQPKEMTRPGMIL